MEGLPQWCKINANRYVSIRYMHWGATLTLLSGKAIRSLFVTILCHCSPNDPCSLWEGFKQDICDDLPHSLPRLFPHIPPPNATWEQAFDYGLYLIDQLLQPLNKSLAVDFPSMPVSIMQWECHIRNSNPLIEEQLSYAQLEEQEKFEANRAQFNADQQHAFAKIEESVVNNRGRLFFFDCTQWLW